MASLLPNPPVAPEASRSLESPLNIVNDTNRGERDGFPDDPRKPIEWQFQPAPTVDSRNPDQNRSGLANEGEKTATVGSGTNGSLSTFSNTQNETIVDEDLTHTTRSESGQVPWAPIEVRENGPDDSGGLRTPMAIELIGAVLQGGLGTKEKMTAMRSRMRTLSQDSSEEKKSQQSNSDDQEAPPSAA